jgi:hypothetical protein
VNSAKRENAWWLPLSLSALLYAALFYVRTQQAWALFGQVVDLYPIAQFLRGIPLDATTDQLRVVSYILLGMISILYLCAMCWAPRAVTSRDAQRRAYISWVVAPYVVLGLVSLILYPSVSAPLDTIDYTVYARIQLVHGGNPYAVPGNDYAGVEPLLQFAEAKQRPAVYGPLALYAGLPPVILGGGELLPSVLGFKILFFLMGLLGVWFIWTYHTRSVAIQSEEVIAAGVLVAWNPILHLVSHGEGHNDILMAVFFAASMVAVGMQKPIWAFVSWTMSFLVKFISAPLAVPLVVWTIRQDQTGGRSAGRRLALVGLILSTLLVSVAFAPFGPAAILQTVFSRYGGLVSSAGESKIAMLSALASGASSRLGMEWSAGALTAFIGLALPLSWILFTMLRGLTVREASAIAVVGVESFLFYLTFVSLPVYAQYVVTPVVLAGFLPARAQWHRAAVVVASLAFAWDSLYLVYPSNSFAPWENYLHQLSHLSAFLVLLTWIGLGLFRSLLHPATARVPSVQP